MAPCQTELCSGQLGAARALLNCWCFLSLLKIKIMLRKGLFLYCSMTKFLRSLLVNFVVPLSFLKGPPLSLLLICRLSTRERLLSPTGQLQNPSLLSPPPLSPRSHFAGNVRRPRRKKELSSSLSVPAKRFFLTKNALRLVPNIPFPFFPPLPASHIFLRDVGCVWAVSGREEGGGELEEKEGR